MKKEILKKEIHHWAWVVFAVLFAAGMIFSLICHVDDYPWDSLYYWEIADDVTRGGGFDILRFPETFRGYAFPVLLSILKGFLPGVLGWQVPANLMAAAEFAFVLPYLFDRRIDKVSSALRVFLSYTVFMWIWGLFLQYPLSDMPAAFCCSAGIALLKWCGRQKRFLQIIAGGIVTGGLLYAAYNTRAGFLYSIWVTVIVYLFLREHDLKRAAVCLMSVILGAMLLSIPQMMINRQYVGTPSPKVYSSQLFGYSRSLQMQQIYWGVSIPRGEAYYGPLIENPGGVTYRDIIGDRILERENVEEGDFTFKSFVKLCLKYPFDMVCIYVRHFLSAMTPCYMNSCYIPDAHVNRGIISSASILLWILAAGVLATTLNRRRIVKALWMGGFLLPGIMQTMGAVELRFFLPAYLLLYFFLGAVADYSGVCAVVKKRPLTVLFGTVMVYLLWMTIFSDLLSSAEGHIFLIAG